jgi:hypothetical protein
MKSTISLIFFISIVLKLFAQSTPVYRYYCEDTAYMVKKNNSLWWEFKDSLKDGKYIAYREKYKVRLDHSKPIVMNDKDFELYETVTFSNRHKQGKDTSFQNGEIRDIVTYNKGKLDGKVIYSVGGKDESTGEYSNGLKSGKWIIYNGIHFKEEIDYSNDSVLEWREYYKNGVKRAEGVGDTYYASGILTHWDTTGFKTYEGEYLNTKAQYVQFLRWAKWDKKKNIREEATGEFRKRDWHYMQLVFGKYCPLCEWQPVNGNIKFYKNNKLFKEEIYKNDSLVETKKYKE